MGFIEGQMNINAKEAVSLIADLTSQLKSDCAKGKITITTMHRSKGLEWPVVIIPALSGLHMPYAKGGDFESIDIESERRLLYVAMTRAKEKLHLFAPGIEMIEGVDITNKPKLEDLPSKFINEMNLPLSTALGNAISNNKDLFYDGCCSKIAFQYRDQAAPFMDLKTGDQKSLLSGGSRLVGENVSHLKMGKGLIIESGLYGITVRFDKDFRFFNLLDAENNLVIESKKIEKKRQEKLPKIGQLLKHPTFGDGTVDDIDSNYIYIKFKKQKKRTVFSLDGLSFG
jgi:DNA helicase-2/ATP-dependent DNA helicase PcrA